LKFYIKKENSEQGIIGDPLKLIEAQENGNNNKLLL
jgi:hypothetical protein